MNESPNSVPSLSVSIVLHHNSLTLFQRTLDSLQLATQFAVAAGELADITVVVIDNSLDEHYAEALGIALQAYPGNDLYQLTLIATTSNQGFGAGHNLAIEDISSDFHLVLNPDVELAEDALSTGLSKLRQEAEVVLLSPRVLGGSGSQEFLCKRYPSVLVLVLRGFAPAAIRKLFQAQLDRYEMRKECSLGSEVEVLLASGCYMLVRSAALRAVGGFKDSYFLYFEDFDLSLRLGAQGRLLFHPAMQIVHHGGYAANKGWRHVWLFLKSGLSFLNEHGWRWI